MPFSRESMKEGDVVGQYRIESKLGAGGMGVVYKGEDTRLHRAVALKFLPPGWTEDVEAKSRFMQEARAASGLDHTNIYTIYEIGETPDGQLYIVTPFYDGETLKYRLESGALPVDEAIDIVTQLLRALRRAHEAGIIHRDIKPANIMVTGRNEVKLLDFGLAKLEAGVVLTKSGSTLGTTAYMSPEQASAKVVDHRSDLWSAGVVLYEMLTGSRPFVGDYEQAIIYKVLNEDPPEITNQDIPPHVSETVKRLLSKDPDKRFGSALEALEHLGQEATGKVQTSQKESTRGARPFILGVAVVLLAALGFWLFSGYSSDVAAPPTTPSVEKKALKRSAIAIMPFSNLRSDPETDFLGYALADQIIGSLTYVSELRVRPSSSIRAYENRQYDTRTAGTDLAVDYILNGTYLKQGEQMRLTIELVDVESDEIIWREPVELEYKNAFDLQDAVSQKVLARLQVEFSPDERKRMEANGSVDPVAYEFYLRGIAQPTTGQGNLVAEQMMRESIKIDSMFSPSWDHLGFRLAQIGQFSLVGEEATRESEDAILKALELNPESFSALSNLSSLYTDLGRTVEAIQLADRMLKINPNSALGHFSRGYALRYAGMTDASVDAMRQAILLDSTDTKFRSAGLTFVLAGLFDEAINAFEVEAGSPYSDYFIGDALLRKGDTTEARAHMTLAASKDTDGLMGMAGRCRLAGLDGDFETGRAVAKRWEEAQIVDAEAALFNAGMYCINADAESCLRNLRLAVDRGYINTDMMGGDDLFVFIRDDPRLQSILADARKKKQLFKEAYTR